MLEQKILEDWFVNQFGPLRAGVLSIESGTVKEEVMINSIINSIQKTQKETYEEWAKRRNYKLNGEDKESISKLNKYIREINQRANDGILTKDYLKEVVNQAYFELYGEKFLL